MAELLRVGRIELPVASKERASLERRTRLLAWGGISRHFIEFGLALGAGIAASSIALIGFGADSLIEFPALSKHVLVHPGDDCHAVTLTPNLR